MGASLRTTRNRGQTDRRMRTSRRFLAMVDPWCAGKHHLILRYPRPGSAHHTHGTWLIQKNPMTSYTPKQIVRIQESPNVRDPAQPLYVFLVLPDHPNAGRSD